MGATTAAAAREKATLAANTPTDEIFDHRDGFAFASDEDQEEYYGNDEDYEYSQDSEEWRHDVEMIAYSAEAPTRDVELDSLLFFVLGILASIARSMSLSCLTWCRQRPRPIWLVPKREEKANH